MRESAFPHPELESPSPAQELLGRLLPMLEQGVEVQEIEGTYEIDSNLLRLSFTLEDDLLEIRNIESIQPGLGRKALSELHSFADKYHMTVVASKVKDTARSFWESQGYYEGSTPDEFVRSI